MKTLTKKNVLLLGSAAMLALAIAGTAGAVVASAEQSIDHEGKTTVTYTQDDSWTITIPESLTVGGAAGQISASGVVLAEGQKLQIKVNSTNNFTLQGEEGGSLNYQLKKAAQEDDLESSGENVTQNGVVLEVEESTGSTYVQATLTDGGNPSTGGEAYTDTLTFSAATVNAD